MSTTVNKIPDSIKKHLDQNEECKEFKSRGVFTKTYYVLTNKRLLVIKKDSLINEASFVSQREENVSLTKNLTLITTKRLVALSEKKENYYEIDFDFTYAEDQEEYDSHKLNALLWGYDWQSPYQASFLILTNNRLILLSNRNDKYNFLKSVDTDNFRSVDMMRVPVLGRKECCIIIRTKDNKPHIAIEHELNNREIVEVFPRKISKAANVSFAAPVLHSTNGSDTFIEFYIKENLQFPEKCSKCGNEDMELVYRTLKLEKTILIERVPHVGLDSVNYRVPYCSNCYVGKAVKKNAFDGVRAILQFMNNNYANDFIRLNTE
ncbi:hypothetical protein KA005_67965 [bacterium]|nr:hypothetical protein [bacterium]